MKKTNIYIIAAAISACAAPAIAEEIFILLPPAQKIGEVFAIPKTTQILYIDRKCKLPIDGRGKYREFTLQFPEKTFGGCWAPLFPDGFITVDEYGNVKRDSGVGYLRALLYKNGTAKLTGAMRKDSPFIAN